MYANYHTHTFRCYHATGPEFLYAERAYRRGITVLGFADHIPMPFPDGHVSTHRMKLSLLPDYVETLLDLREKYRGRMEILIGFEAEYYPAIYPAMMEMLRPYPIDYLILGQHYLGNETASPYVGEPTKDAGRLIAYVDQVISGLQKGVFSCLAHPDVLHYTGDIATYIQHMTRLCAAAKDCGVPLEYNLLGIYERRYYPSPVFWQIAATVGNQVVLGTDAHAPDQMAAPASIEEAERHLRSLGMNPIKEMPLRSLF